MLSHIFLWLFCQQNLIRISTFLVIPTHSQNLSHVKLFPNFSFSIFSQQSKAAKEKYTQKTVQRRKNQKNSSACCCDENNQAMKLKALPGIKTSKCTQLYLAVETGGRKKTKSLT